MIILWGLIILSTLGAWIYSIADEWSNWEFTGSLIMLFSGIALLVASLTIPTSRMGYQADICKFMAFQTTLQEMRKKESIENAAIQIKIAEWNQWLAKSKYWKDSIFGLWVPNDIMKIDPIK